MNLKELTKHLPTIGYGDRIRPVRDWLILLTLALLLLGTSAVWNAILFHRVVNGEGVVVETVSTSTPALDALPKAREVLDARALEAGRYRNFYEFVDPAR